MVTSRQSRHFRLLSSTASRATPLELDGVPPHPKGTLLLPVAE